MRFTVIPPLSLYIHLPWCERKCPYCDFNSYQADAFDEEAYVDRLIEDLELDLPSVWGRQITSIFFGGGTPSLFSGQAIDRLLSNLRACLNLNPAIEITLEANPGSADETRFRDYRQAGINRLSLGVQSFNDRQLARIGRIHNARQATRAFAAARQAGFENINLDLMYGLPGQGLPEAVEDIRQAIALLPEHISHYQLTIEPNTLFHHKTPDDLPDDELGWQMQEQCQRLLAQHGFQQYEISAYARPGQRCRHNLNYWQFGDYLGIGAGAHGKITLPADNKVIRTRRSRQPQAWMKPQPGDLVRQQTELNEQDLAFEFMLNVLRLVDGFDADMFTQHGGLPFALLEPAVKQAVHMGLLENRRPVIKPTARGMRFHNDLLALFLDLDSSICNRVEPAVSFPGNDENQR